MTKLDYIFLKTIKYALSCEKISKQDIIEYESIDLDEWKFLIELADKHKVFPLFYEVTHKFLEECDEKSSQNIKTRNKLQIVTNTMKTNDFLELYQHLNKEGIYPLLVKGLICADTYPKPHLRISFDEDLLIKEDDFLACESILYEDGFFCEDDEIVRNTSCEVSYRKNGSPLYIELHKSLFQQEDDIYKNWNVFFENAHENLMQINYNGVEIYTLDCTLNLLYLICHALKHFLVGGVGIRQICDIVLFSNSFGNNINWQKLFENCHKINIVKFTAGIFKIGEKYLNFDSDILHQDERWLSIEVDELPLLEDVLDAGIYATVNINRVHSSNLTLNAVNKNKSILRILFPERRYMIVQYHYLKRLPWFLPIAWISRCFSYLKNNIKYNEESAGEALKIGKKRVKLLKYYDVI